jgi:beta-phosphoglucomutase family hydrolase
VNPLKAVIFDMDGVIIDSEPLHFESDRRTLETYGVQLDFDGMKRFIGVPDAQTYEILIQEHHIQASVEELLKKQIELKETVFRQVQLEPMEGLLELLDALETWGFKIGLASSSKKAFIEYVLDRLGIQHRFQAVVSGEETQRGKPEPDIFLEAARRLGCAPHQCAVIEDSTHGVQAGRRAGMFVYGIHNPNSGEQDLSQAHLQVHHLKTVKEHLSSISLDGCLQY